MSDDEMDPTDAATYLLGLPAAVQADLADLARTSMAMTEAQKHEALAVITVMAETFAAARNETQMGVLKLLGHAGGVVGSTHQHQTTEGA